MGAARDCLAELQYLSAAFPGDRRDELLRCVTDLFLITADRQRPADTAVFGDVMGRLAAEASLVGRAELARRLADAPRAPSKLIRKLAHDDVGVARPLLERSAALTDTELIDIARGGNPARIAAIARRPVLSTDLTDALARIGDDAVLVQLASNPNAAFSLVTLGRLAARVHAEPSLHHALLRRADLPPVIRERLQTPAMARTAASVGEHAGDGMPDDIGPDSAPAAGCPDDEMEFAATVGGEAEAHLAELARGGQVEDAIMALSAVTGLAPPLVRNCLMMAEIPALVVLCKAHRLASTTLSALLQLRLSAGAISTKSIASAMRRYETMDPHMAQRIMRFLKVRLANPGGR